MRVAIVCDSRPEAGRGHVSRMAAMSAEAKRRDYACEVLPCIERVLDGYDAIIVDDYRPVRAGLIAASAQGRLVVFDDWQPERIPRSTALVVSPGGLANDYPVPTLAGFNYAPLRSREILLSCGIHWHDGMVTHGGQTSLEAAYLGYQQKMEPLSPNVAGQVRRLTAGEVPDGRGAERAWDAIERL
jgi:hypothetical protein